MRDTELGRRGVRAERQMGCEGGEGCREESESEEEREGEGVHELRKHGFECGEECVQTAHTEQLKFVHEPLSVSHFRDSE